jgi:peptide/nickel transport system permease protein
MSESALPTRPTRRRPLRINWPLFLGAFIVAAFALAALIGPHVAPHDPLEENRILQVGETWYPPPVNAFTIASYPLGTDRFGRDLWSQLLWALRPTLTMVLVVALTRLLVGTLIGLGAGWSEGRTAQLLDSLIAAALAIPLLMVALVVIAAVGVELGIWAFILGLTVTGWAEVAQLVREQTRLVRGQEFVEAARAAGSSSGQILITHVLRQIAPLLWMLLSFEISSTVAVTAGLGFLGYYVGGDVWIEVGDWVARRASGAPELGQMLATSRTQLNHPWPMVVVGTAIFLMVLGFNLLGEGLRLRLSVEQLGRRSLIVVATDEVLPWLGQRLRRPRVAALTGAVLLLTLGGLLWWRLDSVSNSSTPAIAARTPVPGNHLWPLQDYDPYGSLNPPALGPKGTVTATLLLKDESGFFGGPAVDAQGGLYVATAGGTLYALTADGTLRWQATLPVTPAVGTPALSADGTIYVVDKAGGLSAFTAAGEFRWRSEPEGQKVAIAGALVAPDGNLYYGYGSNLQAVTPAGQRLWRVRVKPETRQLPPRLSADGTWLCWKNVLVRRADGALLEDNEELNRSQECLYSANGQSYLRTGHIVREWLAQPNGSFTLGQAATWDYDQFTFTSPRSAGVTANRVVWLFYNTFQQTALVWLQPTGQVIGTVQMPLFATSDLLAIDDAATVYLCGGTNLNSVTCTAQAPGQAKPAWQLQLPQGYPYRGGALVPGRLYVTTQDGFLYAIQSAAGTP